MVGAQLHLVSEKKCSQLHATPVMPNPSVEPTRYGRQRKAGPRPKEHFRSPALRCLPPRSSHLER